MQLNLRCPCPLQSTICIAGSESLIAGRSGGTMLSNRLWSCNTGLKHCWCSGKSDFFNAPNASLPAIVCVRIFELLHVVDLVTKHDHESHDFHGDHHCIDGTSFGYAGRHSVSTVVLARSLGSDGI